ncbi:RNA-guided endonuclease TnpB family protein [Catellatospora chokoriensis]|uniref:Transposase n=1 Tax=Catellatospora chokoriensis TaxID=310353 RepID=A0A8J3K485_9ACTN|nr:RNA-guided endonuclease TnpB family protein [Catellatospora chokoriensis]GIF92152.1 hypothetical protein Cch02nite_55960 [Catellatospora chokoriensis]
MIVYQAYRFALDPNATQMAALASHAGASRKAFNWALGLVKAQLDQRAAEKTYGLTDDLLTPITDHARHGPVVGVDVGIKHLAVLSTGDVIDNPRHLAGGAKHLRRLSRRVSPDRRTGREASKRWQKANADRSRAYARVANLRRDGLHKLTTALAADYATIVVEGLNVAGMVRNRRLAKAVSDCGFATIRAMLGYKTTWNGGRLVTAGRWCPSSKTCSDCGEVKTKLPLRVRTFVCDACAMVLDRDLNAARNLARLVEREAGTGVARDPEPRGFNGRGADRRTPLAGQVAVKRPPRPGTVGRQRPTADRELTFAH